jgi:AraC family 4-hydroxyphenylacetate 3-monooxygenase operon regulatory protein
VEPSFIEVIPDINIGRVYNLRDPECDIHYETFEILADFFGRNLPIHRHSSFFQIHLLESGGVHLNLDGKVYSGVAPLLFFTPPTIPHSFYSEEDSKGHVLTIRQDIVRGWFQNMPNQWPDSLLRDAVFLQLDIEKFNEISVYTNLMNIVTLLKQEFFGNQIGQSVTVQSLTQCFFIFLSRLLASHGSDEAVHAERGEDMRLFLNFCDLIELHFKQHLTLTEYANKLMLTKPRLNDICRRMVNQSSKELIHERLLQEARRLLRFSAISINEISYQLGFADPAYFSRFFTKRVGVPPSQFRLTN